MPHESDLQSSILADLQSFGKYCECFKIMKANDNGNPDIFFTTGLTGAVLIEVKRLKGSASEIQKVKIASFNRCGTKAFVCHTWNQWVEIKKTLGMNVHHNELLALRA